MPFARQGSRLEKVASGGGFDYRVPAPWQQAYLGPGSPIQPVSPARDVEVPRSIDYPISVNAQLTPRSGYGLMPFSALSLAYEKVPECRAPVTLIHRQLSSFVPHLIDKHGNVVQDHPYQWMCEYPDGETPFTVWMTRYLKSAKIFDAPALYFERDHTGVKGLHYIDGSTLFVIVDEFGKTPKPEKVEDYAVRIRAINSSERPSIPGAAAGPETFKQFVETYDRRLRDGLSVPDRIPAYTQVIKGTPFAWWPADEIWYMPESRRVNAPYGEPFIEAAWPWIMIVVSLTTFELSHYKTGNMPEGFITLPRDWGVTPDQLEALETAFNRRMTSNPATERNRIRIFPDGSKWFQTKRGEWPQELYERARRIILDSIGVLGSEFGDIPGEGLGGKSFAHSQQSGLNRNTINPNRGLVALPFNHVLKLEGVDDVEITMTYPTQEIDPKELKQSLFEGMIHGLYSLNEARGQLNQLPIGDAHDPSNIANKHWLIAGSSVYVVEDLKDPGGIPVPSFQPNQSGGAPAGPEAEVSKLHTSQDYGTLEKAIRYVIDTGTLDGKVYSIPNKPGTVDKATAQYTQTAKNLSERCVLCRHFRGNSHCDIVVGKISPDGWCKYFEAVPAELRKALELEKYNPNHDSKGRFAPGDVATEAPEAKPVKMTPEHLQISQELHPLEDHLPEIAPKDIVGARDVKANDNPTQAPGQVHHTPMKPPKGPYVDDGVDGDIEVAEQYSKSLAKQLTPGERDAISYYSSYGDEELNNYERNLPYIEETAVILKQRELLDSAIAKNGGIPESTVMYRGLRQVPFDLKAGATFTEPGYTSVSRSRFVAEQFSDKAIMHIKYPQGTPGADIETLSDNQGEQEFLTARNTSFHVDKVKTDRDGLTHVYAHVISRKP